MEEEEEEEAAKQEEQQEQKNPELLKLRAGTLVWAAVGAAFWPAEVADEASFSPPSSSSSSSSSSSPALSATTLVKVRILGLASLQPRVPLGSLRPISDEFERRAREVAGAAGHAGATAVRIAEERMLEWGDGARGTRRGRGEGEAAVTAMEQ